MNKGQVLFSCINKEQGELIAANAGYITSDSRKVCFKTPAIASKASSPVWCVPHSSLIDSNLSISTKSSAILTFFRGFASSTDAVR
jgi:hypothetical protein